ncbi:MAG: response regulator transcription factor [Clostridiaceae bacterium]|nr:response regulator transcription factor [Clostridiaceae bacterium]
MNRILIVEDDISLSNGIVLALKDSELKFVEVHDIKSAQMEFKKNIFDLIILDINLPDGNGLDLLKEIRNKSAVPIIILTANDLETDVVTGLELGADDYITKPFSLMILRARVAARLRNKASVVTDTIIIDDFRFSFSKMKFSKRNIPIELSKTEQKLLRLLVQNKGYTLTRAQLIDDIWTGDAEYVDENALSVTVKRLRNKLEDRPSTPKYIKTIYGIGYTWAVI